MSKKSRKESKSLKKVSEKSLFDTFLGLFDSFRDFLGTPSPEVRGDFFETFWGFWAQRARETPVNGRSGLNYVPFPEGPTIKKI